jgi:hypothetical protein
VRVDVTAPRHPITVASITQLSPSLIVSWIPGLWHTPLRCMLHPVAPGGKPRATDDEVTIHRSHHDRSTALHWF